MSIQIFCRLRRQNIFFRARILLILLCKINKIRALKKNILWRRKPPKDAGGFLHNPSLLHKVGGNHFAAEGGEMILRRA